MRVPPQMKCPRCGALLRSRIGDILSRCVSCDRAWPPTADYVAQLEAALRAALERAARGGAPDA